MENYSPGFNKFIQHIDHIKNMNDKKIVAPIHVSIWPTFRCNLKCKYCCFKNIDRNNQSDLDIADLKSTVDILQKYGTKAIEWAGGGEPTMWEHLPEAIDYVYDKNIKMSLITNGMFLDKIPKSTINKLSWLRISFQSLKHAKSINYDHINEVKYSASYMISNDGYDKKTIDALFSYVSKMGIILRIGVARPCTNEYATEVKNLISTYGHPMFFSDKEDGEPLSCYMAWVRAAIDWNGNFYACPSIQLNTDYEGFIPKEFILCKIKDLEKWLNDNPPHDLGFRCKFCNCGKEINDFFYNINRRIEDVEFV